MTRKASFLSLVLLLAALLSSVTGQAQLSKKDFKKYKKAHKKVDKGQLEEAEELYLYLASEYPDVAELWNELAELQSHVYEKKKASDALFDNITITVDGEEPGEEDSLALLLLEMIKNNKPSDIYFKKFMRTCRIATLRNKDAYYPSMFLRSYNIDVIPDTAIPDEAQTDFNQAEEYFRTGNYEVAITHYRKALEIYPGFYKAGLYLGDCYYAMEDYTMAARYFKKAVEIHPDQLEPRKYLTDAYSYGGKHREALEECIQSFLIYPDAVMFIKWGDLAELNEQSGELHWLERKVLPNTMDEPDTVLTAESSWKHYVSAFNDIDDYCNEHGVIVKDNALTDSQYMEVYSWEKMLKSAPGNEFPFARKMQEMGYLDCYVFLSLYHYDLYPQYKHFVSNNRQKAEEYFKLLLDM